MSGKLTVRESALVAENEVLKGNYVDLLKEHETLEVMEKKHETLIQTVEVLEKKQREAVAAKEEVKHWEKKYCELQMRLEKLEKDVEYLNSSGEFGVDSGVIELSSDDEDNQRENCGGGGRESNSQNQEKVSLKL